MKIATKVAVVALARQDDLPGLSARKKRSAKYFVEKYLEKLKYAIDQEREFTFEDSFYVLGRASLAMIFNCERLFNVPELIQLITKTHRDFRLEEKEKGSGMGTFETYCFPAIEAKLSGHRKASGNLETVIPTLIFVRMNQKVETCIELLATQTAIAKNMRKLYVGFGLYDLILSFSARTIYELRDLYCQLRSLLSPFWETATVIGVPNIKMREIEKTLAEPLNKIPFSTSAKCVGGYETNVNKAMASLFQKPQFRRFLFERNQIPSKLQTNLRQGYMDVEVHYWANTVSDAFDISCAIREISGVVDTCTVAGLPFENRNFRSDL